MVELRQVFAGFRRNDGRRFQHLAIAAKGKYGPDRALMVGDAPGDMKAAKANGFLFFPINPGAEEASWKEFHDEGLKRFFAGDFAGDYEESRIAAFEECLPEKPPWDRG